MGFPLVVGLCCGAILAGIVWTTRNGRRQAAAVLVLLSAAAMAVASHHEGATFLARLTLTLMMLLAAVVPAYAAIVLHAASAAEQLVRDGRLSREEIERAKPGPRGHLLRWVVVLSAVLVLACTAALIGQCFG